MGDLAVAFPAGRGVPRWRERNAQSPVPGDWPYGLDRLRTGAAQLRDIELAPPGRLQRIAAERLGVRRRPAKGDDVVDVALCWDEATAVRMVPAVAARRMYAGVIWATDEVLLRHAAAEYDLTRKALLRLDGLWVLARPQVDAVRTWLGADCPPVSFLRFGVDTDFYAATPYPDRPCVVSIGGDRDRDAGTLFRALEIVLARRPDVECIVQSKAAIEPPIGVTKREFIPHDEVRRLYARASLVAIPTRMNWHASGMTVGLEALSCARPVVGTGTPGMGDYFVDRHTGRLTPVENPDAVAAAILELLDDPAAAARMGAAGRLAVEARHSTATMCADLLDIVAGPA